MQAGRRGPTEGSLGKDEEIEREDGERRTLATEKKAFLHSFNPWNKSPRHAGLVGASKNEGSGVERLPGIGRASPLRRKAIEELGSRRQVGYYLFGTSTKLFHSLNKARRVSLQQPHGYVAL